MFEVRTGMNFFRQNLMIVVCLAILFILIYAIQKVPNVDKLGHALQTDSIPTGILEFGTMGKIFHRLNLLKVIRNDENRYPLTENYNSDLDNIAFQKKRRVGSILFQVNEQQSTGLPQPESNVLRSAPHQRPVLSINIDLAYLFDKQMGIVANYPKNGRSWEQIAHVTLQNPAESQPLMSTAVGIRLKDSPLNLVGEKNNYTLYFRKMYGTENIPQSFFQTSNRIPEPFVTNVLEIEFIRYDINQAIRKYAAYQLTRMSGCISGQSQFAEVVINGQQFGLALITSKISARSVAQHYKPDKSSLIENVPYLSINELFAHKFIQNEFQSRNIEPSIKNAESLIEYDNFSRYIFVMAYLGLPIDEQRTILHESADGLKLSWLIHNLNAELLWGNDFVEGTIPQAFSHPGLVPFGLPKKSTHDTGRLFSDLAKNSVKFRKHFIQVAVHLLNHELHPTKILKKIEDQLLLTGADDHWPAAKLTSIRQYISHRSDYLLEEMKLLFDLGNIVNLRITGPAGIGYRVDGFDEMTEYAGKYFQGQMIDVSLVFPEHQLRLSHWLINGAPVFTRDLRLQINEDSVLEAVFEKKE
jgi:hypothetical protein